MGSDREVLGREVPKPGETFEFLGHGGVQIYGSPGFVQPVGGNDSIFPTASRGTGNDSAVSGHPQRCGMNP